MKLVAFDPGLTTGWALFEEGQVSKVGESKWEDELFTLFKFEYIQTADLFIVEDFLLQKERNQRWTRLETPQVIGAIKLRAHQLGVPVVMQQPSIKPVAFKWMETEKPKGHAPHYLDAVAHGNYYLIKNKLKLPGSR